MANSLFAMQLERLLEIAEENILWATCAGFIKDGKVHVFKLIDELSVLTLDTP